MASAKKVIVVFLDLRIVPIQTLFYRFGGIRQKGHCRIFNLEDSSIQILFFIDLVASANFQSSALVVGSP